jgi:hypothetical protein
MQGLHVSYIEKQKLHSAACGFAQRKKGLGATFCRKDSSGGCVPSYVCSDCLLALLVQEN